MYNIAGVNIPLEKSIYIALQYIYGIGKYRSKVICEKSLINKNKKVFKISNQEMGRVRRIIESLYCIEGNLKTRILLNIKELIDIKCYRGVRHSINLPVRGQRTQTNAKTRKRRR